jgi:aminopeptidase N
MKVFFILLFSAFYLLPAHSQTYSRADTLRGSITPERAWWDLNFYHLDIEVNPFDSTIKGSNEVRYTVLESMSTMQIDLQAPLKITRVTQDNQELTWTQEGPAYFIKLQKNQLIGHQNSIKIYYSGRPHIAQRAPWDGGISWKTDDNGKPFVASSCQGIGASIWWPNKDHMYDEADSVLLTVTVPKGLMNVGNGRLIKKEEKDDKVLTEWMVRNPINNYGVNINIGDYVHFGEVYDGEKGPLDMDYYVLRDNLSKAKKQFKQAPEMMEAFEYWFGPYPFYEDGYKLVETPYLGMEHQSSITYGNDYENGYRGMDLSDSGWGLKFDFIIIHESGHEWFANNITYKDMADMWVHESFTAYSEALYVEYFYGAEAGADYVLGTRMNINNDKAIIAPYGVNARGSGDMYYKGSNMLHTIRHVVNNDTLWRATLRGLNETFYHQTITSQQIEEYMSQKTGVELKPVFDQYLRGTQVPILEYKVKEGGVAYRWNNVVNGFEMPLEIRINGKAQRIKPAKYWKFLETREKIDHITVDRDYLVAQMNITGK